MIKSLSLAACLLALACNTPAPPASTDTEKAPAQGATPSDPGAAKPAADETIPPPPDVAAPPADAQKTATGLATKLLAPGTGDKKPLAHDKVSVHYTGWTTDGKMFDSSVKRGRPATFDVKGVIPGWTEALQLMVKGEKRRLWIPEELAYKGRAGSPQGMLVFDVELLDIVPGVAPVPAPEDVAAPPADAKKTPSGLATKVLSPGTSKDKPNPWDKVTVNYTGWSTDGQMVDSSLKRGRPATFDLSKVMPGWSEGIALMTTGEKRRMWIPEELGYKDRPGAPKGMLVFDMELVAIERMPEPPKAPPDVKAAPAGAKKTASGLAYKVLKKGTGKTHPTAASKVEVHYTGWTTDGKMFDSSVTRGKSITFGLGQVIPGWTEGVQLMVEGEKARLWIPEELAYKGRPGAPAGMLVFDVELIKIVDQGAAPAAPATPATPATPAAPAAPAGH
jgi:FKBP-type peptidyl-prolyl cis-trans isomerase